ncbi:STAS-like domain-containing protein [Bacillus cereus group sp. BY5-1LC]|uniref:STAS-like domain-containing protein n=1 Tax=Bacillus cereus group sp. BY5-1LC TaxID=3018078 RepID=UPI0022E2579D|nr:STAS-like domain-containing protein [Bacillus cereus group sp. BY5-1LC]MDA1789204.1 STAS-like domain-containing protein [Bacillus cereus group sp. BY5-1LC]
MVNINVLDHVERCYSNDDGKVIQDLIRKAFMQNEKAVVSFQGVTALNSSFVNTAFIELLNDYDFSYIRNHLTFVNSTAQINTTIKNRFNFEVNERKNLVTA